MANKSASGSGSIRKKTVVRNGKTYHFWEARYTEGVDPGTGKQKQRSITGKTQKEVAAKLNAATAAIKAGTYRAPDKTTVGQWLDEWLEVFCVNTVKPLTLSSYKKIVEKHLKPELGAVQVQALRGTHIQRLYNNLTHKGSRVTVKDASGKIARDQNGKAIYTSAPLSPKTVKNIGAVLHKALSMAVKQGIIPSNPADAAELPKVPKHQIKPLEDADIPRFLAAIDEHPFRNAYALCLLAGLREGECLGLSWKQIDFKAHRITISQQLQKSKEKGGGYYIAKSTKSSKSRTIEPPLVAFEYLEAEKKKQAANRLRAGQLWNNPDDLVFTDEAGRHYAVYTFYERFKRIAAGIGRPDLRPHDLRHTAATVAIAAGADIKSVQDLLGHATASFTLDVYAHTSDQMMKDTASRMQSYYDSLKQA